MFASKQCCSLVCSSAITELAEQLRRCARSKTISHGKQLHARIKTLHLGESTFLGNLLVQMYGSCGDHESALSVFSGIKQRNIFSWNILLSGAVTSNRHSTFARALFDRIPQRDTVSWNLIITMYAQQASVQQAREIFDRIPDQGTVTWNAMISAYAQNGYPTQALDLFKLMQLEGAQSDRITFTSTIDACSESSAIAQGRLIHSEIQSSGVALDRKVYNSLINMYGKAGLVIDAKSVFDSMRDRDVVSWTSLMMSFSGNRQLEQGREIFEKMPQRDTTAWNALIIDFSRSGKLDQAAEISCSIPDENPISSTTMIAAYAQNGHLLEARLVFDKMHDPDVISWNAIIAAYVQQGLFSQGVGLFQEMTISGTHPNRITFISALHASARAAILSTGKCIHEEIEVRGWMNDATLIAMLINVYGRCGRMPLARCLFYSLPELNIVLWNTMLAAYAHNGDSPGVVNLFQEMLQNGAEPDPVSFITILATCSHSGLLGDAGEFFRSMVGDHGVAPAKDHFACLIDLMGRLGQLENAEELVTTMEYEPDVVTLTTLAGACRVHRDASRGSRLSELAMAAQPRSSSPYALLSNLFQD